VKNLEEFMAENPELADKLMAEAHAAASEQLSAAEKDTALQERTRLQEIDEISALYSDEIVRNAKYGENPCTAQELSHREAVRQAKESNAFMENALADSKASGAQDVPASAGGNIPDEENKTDEQKRSDAKNWVQSLLGKKEG